MNRKKINTYAPAHLMRTVRLGVKSLWLHRLRSLLTVLGIVFGVCSVISMLAVGEGASYEAQEQIKRLGSNNIILRSVKPPEDQTGAATAQRMAEYGITYYDINQIEATIPSIRIVVPNRNIRKDVWHIEKHVDCDVVGTVPWYPDMRNHKVKNGRFFTANELEAETNVCVLSERMAKKLFPIDWPIKKRVRVGGTYFQVIGVMESEEAAEVSKSDSNGEFNGNGGQNEGAPHQMYIPLSTAKDRFGEIIMKRAAGSRDIEKVELHEVTAKVAKREDVIETAAIIGEIIKKNHKKVDYEIVVPLQLLRQAERTKQIFNIVLGAIAAISLIVGGIGIMNIMLASVTERTREIGIRRALGAKRQDIITQFLVETVILSGTGGLIGVALGLAIPFFITIFADMKTVVTPWSPVIAFSISALVGIIFGIYPAFRAANMDPVEALRHE